MQNKPVTPSQDAWTRVTSAVKKVESGITTAGGMSLPHLQLPAAVVKVTGTPTGGYYPGKILAWNSNTAAWIELEDCWIRQEGA